MISLKKVFFFNNLNIDLLEKFKYISFLIHIGKERTFQRADQITSDPKKNCGYKHLSLIIDIPFSRFIIDILHQYLRISELLLFLLLDKLAYLDKLQQEGTEYNPEKHKHLRILSEFFIDKCEMNLIESGSKFKDFKLKIKNLMEPKKRIILNNITSESCNIHTMFSQYLPESLKIHNLCKDYNKLNFYIR